MDGKTNASVKGGVERIELSYFKTTYSKLSSVSSINSSKMFYTTIKKDEENVIYVSNGNKPYVLNGYSGGVLTSFADYGTEQYFIKNSSFIRTILNSTKLYKLDDGKYSIQFSCGYSYTDNGVEKYSVGYFYNSEVTVSNGSVSCPDIYLYGQNLSKYTDLYIFPLKIDKIS